MSIKKMLLAAVMALAAIAFAVPAAAQATVQLTDPAGTALQAGAKVTATSTNLRTTVGADALECELVTVHLEVENPGPSKLVLVSADGGVTTKNCKTASGFPVTIIKPGIQKVTVNTWGAGSVEKATFNREVFSDPVTHENPITTPCHYQGGVNFHATHETDELHLTPSTLTGTPSGSCANGVIHGSFTLETPDPNNTPVTIDFTTTL